MLLVAEVSVPEVVNEVPTETIIAAPSGEAGPRAFSATAWNMGQNGLWVEA